ncbi:MAG: electron transfer flavoprotein subunit alpha/FixB family protein [Candidatus Promineifilaceae bacterium]|nr:electron transfer flavoprotein subunit alpha/FixB family protein [Chloroflexota bacterium]MBK7176553.1 electron transfer flavoprotein subunit alpha/FixB family protein [Chloroflexota bacterium]MBK8933999.1 electron transfer flavoprotein subunit alpha/FixB family protein [Chloroflexota bacterium]
MSGVWVFIENRDGEIAAIAKEALAAARTVADGLGETLTALVFGQDVAGVADAAFAFGADAVLGADDATLSPFRVEAVGPLVAQLAKERQPGVILAGASTRGRDLAAWVAADLDAGLVADGTDLAVDGGTVKVTRPVYASKLLATVFVTGGMQIITLRNRAFPQAESTGGSGSAEWVDTAVAESDIPTKVTGFAGKEGTISLTDANIIVSGGRGVGGPEGFAPVQELANVLGAALGASRAAVDAGWIPYEHQVGQTGKTVSPDLYIANGISGAIQHQAGMRTSKVIVAINKDPEAPIFKLAQYGIVGDLFEVLPALTAEFKKKLG